jgi:NADP-dependent 3-hydroxy acid dehydrogenase YdfG
MLSRDVAVTTQATRARGWTDQSYAAFAIHQAYLDVTDRTIRKVSDHLGKAPDIVVNNAAEFYVTPAHETAVEDFQRTLTVNLTSHFAIVRAFLPEMRARRAGHIVTIGSIADHTPLRGNVAYGASKYALRGMHEVLREELRGTGVRTTLISPARVDTTIWDDVNASVAGETEPGMLAATDVAEAVMFALTRAETVNVDEVRMSRS